MMRDGRRFARDACDATAAKSLVNVRQLEITDVRLGNSYGSYHVTGRIKNNSPHTITGISARVQFRDCNPDCVVVGDQVIDVSEEDRAVAFANIEKAARYYDVDLWETNWQQLGAHPKRNRKDESC